MVGNLAKTALFHYSPKTITKPSIKTKTMPLKITPYKIGIIAGFTLLLGGIAWRLMSFTEQFAHAPNGNPGIYRFEDPEIQTLNQNFFTSDDKPLDDATISKLDLLTYHDIRTEAATPGLVAFDFKTDATGLPFALKASHYNDYALVSPAFTTLLLHTIKHADKPSDSAIQLVPSSHYKATLQFTNRQWHWKIAQAPGQDAASKDNPELTAYIKTVDAGTTSADLVAASSKIIAATQEKQSYDATDAPAIQKAILQLLYARQKEHSREVATSLADAYATLDGIDAALGSDKGQ